MPKDKISTDKKRKIAGLTKRKKVEKRVAKKVKTTQKKGEKRIENSKYIEAIGRRKKAVARVRIWSQGPREFLVNGKPVEDYFSQPEFRQIAAASLEKINYLDKFRVSVLVRGGGLHAQATAIRHGTARALIIFNPDFRKKLKKAGFLTRDPRMRERKKFGLKRARRAPQWQKR